MKFRYSYKKNGVMYNFIKEILGIDRRKEHEKLNNLRFLFITGELSKLNRIDHLFHVGMIHI